MDKAKMNYLVESDKVGILTNSIFKQMLSIDLNIKAIPPINFESYIDYHEFKAVVIELEIYEQDHPWFNKSYGELINYLKQNEIEIIIMSDCYKKIPDEFLEYKTLIVDNTINEIVVENNKIYTPLLVNEKLFNPKKSNAKNDIVYFKFDNYEFPIEILEYQEKFKPKTVISSVNGITAGLISSLTKVIKNSDIVYIFDSEKMDRLLLEYLEIISILQNTLVIIRINNDYNPIFAFKSDSFDEDIVIIRTYLRNDLYRNKYILSKNREAFLNHTYINKGKFLDLLNFDNNAINKKNYLPDISVVACTRRKENVISLINQINTQKNVDLEIILLTHGFIFNQEEIEAIVNLSNFRIKVINEKSSTSFGECLNKCLRYVRNNYFIKIDDDDFYFPNFIIDLWIGLKYSGADIVGKNAFFFYLETDNLVGQRRIDNQFKNIKEVKGNTIFCSTKKILKYQFSNLQKHVDSDLFERVRIDGGIIYAIHPFDMCVFRADDKKGHTYQVNDSRFLRDAKMLYNGAPNRTICTE